MSEIKLEVGQVWKSREFIFDILKLWDGKVAYYAHSSNGVNTYSELAFLSDGLKLITNADGTPHTPPNDYQAGDVWESVPNQIAILITMYDDNLCMTSKFRSEPETIINTRMDDEPQNYRLIYREGQGVINAKI